MTVNTTFLPKTNGLVFDPRLQARSDKGRVYGLVGGETEGGQTEPPVAATPPGITGQPFVFETLTVDPPDVAGSLAFPYSGFSYVWGYATETKIIGTGETYVVQPEDVGKQIVVAAVVRANRNVVLPSEPTPAVGWLPPNPQVVTPPPANLHFELGKKIEVTAEFSVRYQRQGTCFQFINPDGQPKPFNRGQIEKAYPGTEVRITNADKDADGLSVLTIEILSKDGGFPTQGRYRVKDENTYTGQSASDIELFTVTHS